MLGCLVESERNTVLIISKDKKTNVYVFFIIQTSVYTIKLLKQGIFCRLKQNPLTQTQLESLSQGIYAGNRG